MKVGKEEIIGMLAAVEYWSHADLDALNKEWRGRVERIAKLVETVPGVTTNITIPEEGNSYPTLTVLWDEKAFGLTVAQCDQQSTGRRAPIEVLTNSNPSLVPVVREGDDPKEKQEAPPKSVANYFHDAAMREKISPSAIVSARFLPMRANALRKTA